MSRSFLAFALLLTACTAKDDAPAEETDGWQDEFPELPAPAEPQAYSEGECPKLVRGENTGFTSAGFEREFQIAMPKEPEGAGVLFAWHGNGDSGGNFAAYLGAPELAKKNNVIVVTPTTAGNMLGFDWPIPPAKPTRDETFFNDLLGCLDQQFKIDRRRVFTTGFSAGALWSSYLVMHFADHLAAAVIFSGGADGGVATVGEKVNPYNTPAWDIPVLMTEGGPSDQVVIKFNQMTEAMSTQLRADGSTAIVCPHSYGHTPPPGHEAYSWPFLFAHVYGETPSPYASDDPSGALPASCTRD